MNRKKKKLQNIQDANQNQGPYPIVADTIQICKMAPPYPLKFDISKMRSVLLALSE